VNGFLHFMRNESCFERQEASEKRSINFVLFYLFEAINTCFVKNYIMFHTKRLLKMLYGF